MSDDLMINAVAAALVHGSGDTLTDLARVALARLKRSVYARRGVDTATAAALANAQARPSSEHTFRDLCAALTEAVACAPALADDVRLLWRHLQQPGSADPGGDKPNPATAAQRPTIPTMNVHIGNPSRERSPVWPNPGA